MTRSLLLSAIWLASLTGLLAAPGDLKWSFAAKNAIRSSPALGTNGLIYFGSSDAKVYALEANSGEKRWEFTTFAEVISSPIIGPDNSVYVASMDGQFYAIDGALGKKRWSVPTEGHVISSPALGANGLIYFTSWYGVVHACDSANGKMKWVRRFDLEGTFGSPSIGADGTVFCAVAGRPWQPGGLNALDGATGEIRWSFPSVNQIQSTPAIGPDGTIYIGSFDKFVYAFDPRTGKTKWSHLTGDSISSSPTVGPDGTIYVGANDGRLYALNPADGSEKWVFTTFDTIHSSAAVAADGTVYVGSYDRNVYAVDGRTGEEKWRLVTGGFVLSSPVIAEDGTVFIGSQDGKLYALEGSSPPAESSWPSFKGGGQRAGSAEREGPPVMVTPPGHVLAVEDAYVFLDAVIQGTRPMSFQWWFNGGPASLLTTNHLRLEFTNARLGDSGEYTLVASNAFGLVRATGRLDVGFSLSIQPSAGGIISAEPNQDIYLPGSVVELTAHPANKRTFLRWSGDATDSGNPRRVIMNGHKQVAANFSAIVGEQIWEVPFLFNDYVAHPIAIGDFNTVFLSAMTNLLALSGDSGLQKWRYNTTNRIVTTPTVAPDGSVVFAVEPNSLYALDERGGAVKWRTTPGRATASPAVSADGTIYLVTQEHGRSAVTAIDGATGSTKWRYAAAGYISYDTPPALGTNGLLYVVSDLGAAVTAIDARTGQSRWTVFPAPQNQGAGVSRLALGGGEAVYVQWGNGQLFALNGRTGSTRWTALQQIAAVPPIIGRDNTIHAISADGFYLELDVFGNEVAKPQRAIQLNNWMATLALAADQTLYGISQSGLVALSTETGALKWHVPVRDLNASSPIIGPDGTVYVMSTFNSEARLIAIKGNAPPADAPWPMVGNNPRNTSALNAKLPARILEISNSPSETRITVRTVAGRMHHLEFKNSLAESDWTQAATINGDGLEHKICDPAIVRTHQRFYRVRVE